MRMHKNDHSRGKCSSQACHIDLLKYANMAILLIFICVFPELFHAADDTFARATPLLPQNPDHDVFRTEFNRLPCN
jgi:hypothetical protein